MANIIKRIGKFITKVLWEIGPSWIVKNGKLNKLRIILTGLTFYMFLVLYKKYVDPQYLSDAYVLGILGAITALIFTDVYKNKG